MTNISFKVVPDCTVTDRHKLYNFKRDILLNVLNVKIAT